MNKLYEDVTETSGPQLRQKLNNLDNWVICKKKKTKKTDALVSVFLKMYPKITLRYAHAIEIWWLFGNRSINFVKNLASRVRLWFYMTAWLQGHSHLLRLQQIAFVEHLVVVVGLAIFLFASENLSRLSQSFIYGWIGIFLFNILKSKITYVNSTIFKLIPKKMIPSI